MCHCMLVVVGQGVTILSCKRVDLHQLQFLAIFFIVQWNNFVQIF